MAKKPFNRESEKQSDPADMPPALAAEYAALMQALEKSSATTPADELSTPNSPDIASEESSPADEEGDDDTASAAMDELLLAIRASTVERPLNDDERDAWLKATRQRLAAKRAEREAREKDKS